MLAEKILAFLRELNPPRVPEGVEVLNPYQNPEVWKLCEAFYHRYYADNHPRILVMGINPGRLGGGTTGIPFTDPLKLKQYCGLANHLPPKAELSADFIYRVIEKTGGPDIFYRQVYIGAVSPLGFTQNGKNLNYYDDKTLWDNVKAFCIQSLRRQLYFGIKTNTVFCLGEGKNYEFLQRINQEHKLFTQIVPLPHPRFIMQYKRKHLDRYVNQYARCIAGEFT